MLFYSARIIEKPKVSKNSWGISESKFKRKNWNYQRIFLTSTPSFSNLIKWLIRVQIDKHLLNTIYNKFSKAPPWELEMRMDSHMSRLKKKRKNKWVKGITLKSKRNQHLTLKSWQSLKIKLYCWLVTLRNQAKIRISWNKRSIFSKNT